MPRSTLAGLLLIALVLSAFALATRGKVQAVLAADRQHDDGTSAPLPMPKVSDLKTSATSFPLLATGHAGKQAGQVFSTVEPFADGRSFYLPINVEFRTAADCASFKHDGFTLISRVDRFADFFVPAELDQTQPTGFPSDEASKTLRDDKSVVWYDRGIAIVVPPPLPLVQSAEQRASEESTALRGVGEWKGRGVTIAIIDTGVDFHHPDFTHWVNGQQQSRIKFFWDTTANHHSNAKFGAPGPCKDPTGTPIGTLYSQSDLSQNLDRTTSVIPEGDAAGHGTACASIAAGNGSATKKDYEGVAPEADLVAIRIAKVDSLENVYLLGAICDWLETVAKDRPLVVSCSFASQFGGHDGTTVLEREFNARFPLDKPGRALCIAAGNDGFTPFHLGFDFGAASSNLSWKVDPAISEPWSTEATKIQIWVATDKLDDLNIIAPSGSRAKVIDRFVHPFGTNQKACCIELNAPAPEGTVQFTTTSGKTYSADAYAIFGPALLNPATTENTVGCPGTASNAITVGSYNWNYNFNMPGSDNLTPIDDPITKQQVIVGQRSDFSSIGYRRDEDSDNAGKPGFIVKPDFLAPGQWFTAAAPPIKDLQLDSTGMYQAFSGTSAAAPYTAGVVALMFEANPHATFGQIKDALRKSLTRPPRADGNVPNPKWGYGKLDLAAVKAAINSIKADNKGAAGSP